MVNVESKRHWRSVMDEAEVLNRRRSNEEAGSWKKRTFDKVKYSTRTCDLVQAVAWHAWHAWRIQFFI